MIRNDPTTVTLFNFLHSFLHNSAPEELFYKLYLLKYYNSKTKKIILKLWLEKSVQVYLLEWYIKRTNIVYMHFLKYENDNRRSTRWEGENKN